MTAAPDTPDRNAIAARLKKFLEDEFPGSGVELTAATNLLDDWVMDSLRIVTTVLFLESEFNIKVGRADINGTTFATIDSLTDLVVGRMTSPKAD
jgi:acyl carrier protein